MRIDILSLFPEYFSGPFDQSIIKRAQAKGIIDIRLTDIRTFSEGRHQRVDDRAFGGGPGMVMMAEPVEKAICSVESHESHVIYLSPKGTPLTAAKCRELADKKHLVLLCGHYEGIDQRVLDRKVDEELSIGDYVLTNGCLAAIVLVDAMARFIPGVIGHAEAALQDSFEKGLLDCPHYTRPEHYKGEAVPEVLLAGDHQKVAAWRLEQSLIITQRFRPDLWVRYLAMQESAPLNEGQQEKKRKGCLRDAGKSGRIVKFNLKVKDLKRSKKFYRDILGLECLSTAEDRVVLQLEDQQIILLPGGNGKSRGDSFEIQLSSQRSLQSAAQWVSRTATGETVLDEKQQLLAVTVTDPDGYLWIMSVNTRNLGDKL